MKLLQVNQIDVRDCHVPAPIDDPELVQALWHGLPDRYRNLTTVAEVKVGIVDDGRWAQLIDLWGQRAPCIFIFALEFSTEPRWVVMKGRMGWKAEHNNHTGGYKRLHLAVLRDERGVPARHLTFMPTYAEAARLFEDQV